MVCHECKEGQMRPAEVMSHIAVGTLKFRTLLPGLQCEKCGTQLVPGPQVEAFERQVAEVLVRTGQNSGDVLRFIRKAVGLRAKDVAEVLDMSPEHISRLENGGAVPARTMALVGSMVLDMIKGRPASVVEALEAQMHPRPLGVPMDLTRAA